MQQDLLLLWGKRADVTLLQLQDHQIDAVRQSKSSRNHYQSGAIAWARLQLDPVLVVTGMAAEARLAAGPGVITIMAGGNPGRLRTMLRARLQPDCRGLRYRIRGLYQCITSADSTNVHWRPIRCSMATAAATRRPP